MWSRAIGDGGRLGGRVKVKMEKEDGDGDARFGWWKKEASVKQESKRCVAGKCCC